MSSRMRSFLRNRALRAQLAFAVAKVAAPIGLVAALLIAGAPRQGAPVAATGTPVAAASVPDGARLP